VNEFLGLGMSSLAWEWVPEPGNEFLGLGMSSWAWKWVPWPGHEFLGLGMSSLAWEWVPYPGNEFLSLRMSSCSQGMSSCSLLINEFLSLGIMSSSPETSSCSLGISSYSLEIMYLKPVNEFCNLGTGPKGIHLSCSPPSIPLPPFSSTGGMDEWQDHENVWRLQNQSFPVQVNVGVQCHFIHTVFIIISYAHIWDHDTEAMWSQRSA